jgi:DNA uptake protein ComE-like DNA-binding protein
MNRIQLFAFVVAAGIAVAFCFCFAPVGVAAGDVVGTVKLESRINPNDAPQASLARLPGIGLVRAQAIVTYREQFRQTCPERSRRDGKGDLAFQDCNDLDKVKGIGPATARQMCEWLKFQ